MVVTNVSQLCPTLMVSGFLNANSNQNEIYVVGLLLRNRGCDSCFDGSVCDLSDCDLAFVYLTKIFALEILS
jgi:hypothetical protein